MTEHDQAIEDAQRLLHYASAKAIALEPDVSKNIVAAQALVGKAVSDQSTFQQQEEFWAALAKLSKATYPVTIQSLRYTAATKVTWRAMLWAFITRKDKPVEHSVAGSAVWSAGAWAFVALFIVATFQAYYEVANSTVTGYVEAERTYSEKREFVRMADPNSLTGAPSKELDPTLRVEISKALAAMQQAESSTARKLRLLQDMLFWVDWKSRFATEITVQAKAHAMLSVVQGMLVILRDFILAMAWGFLGATLYVSRALAENIRSMSYSPDSAILHRSRYYMGTVAGFVVAKVYPSGGNELASVTPFALALIFGYSVEVLFSLFDRLISTFSAKSTP